MKPETLKVGDEYVVTFPQKVGSEVKMTELLRVSEKGQVVFNYKDWRISTATDAFFRNLAEEAPSLCQRDLKAEKAICEANLRTSLQKVDRLEEQQRILLQQGNETASFIAVGIVFVIFGFFAGAWVHSKVSEGG